MTNPKNKSNSNNNSLVEFFSIFAAMIIIFIIWANYPRFMQDMDKSVNEKKTQIIIPFKDPQPAKDLKQETRFEKIGEKYGTYGDSYGSLNTLFSGLAFAILIISLFMQRQELQAQRLELEAQRNEISESNEIARQQRQITEQQKVLNEQQIKDARVQNFYDLLFRYLNRYELKFKAIRYEPQGNYHINYFEQYNKYVFFYLEQLDRYDSPLKNHSDSDLNIFINASLSHAHKDTGGILINEQYYEQVLFIISFIFEHQNLGVTNSAIKILGSYLGNHEKLTILFGAFQYEKIKLFAKNYRSYFDSDLSENNEYHQLVKRLAII